MLRGAVYGTAVANAAVATLPSSTPIHQPCVQPTSAHVKPSPTSTPGHASMSPVHQPRPPHQPPASQPSSAHGKYTNVQRRPPTIRLSRDVSRTPGCHPDVASTNTHTHTASTHGYRSLPHAEYSGTACGRRAVVASHASQPAATSRCDTRHQRMSVARHGRQRYSGGKRVCSRCPSRCRVSAQIPLSYEGSRQMR
ncbi:hypothetical protein NPIL_692731 [Nephila pilipes]|uniref:Uncharacterized protein n=1 Tax=Nephila pilipes TaxID=299642 RepID=A0A8X6UGY8_NEPPI|nr:hypothetical protein NPIL_692731 [Nephila pilipes]